MTNPRSGRAAISGQEQEPKRLKQPAGKDDATGWTHGGTDTLRDSEGGTYGTLPGEARPEQVREPAADDRQPGADVRHEAEPVRTTLPAGLIERKGSVNKTSGRRSADKA
jgi:hypothetical protein